MDDLFLMLPYCASLDFEIKSMLQLKIFLKLESGNKERYRECYGKIYVYLRPEVSISVLMPKCIIYYKLYLI